MEIKINNIDNNFTIVVDADVNIERCCTKKSIYEFAKYSFEELLTGELMWLHLFILRTFRNSELKYKYE